MKKEITQEQINEWKEKHGGVFELPVEDKTCYLREPKMTDYKRAFIAMQNDGDTAFAESMLAMLWLEGDEEIKTDNFYFTPAKKELVKLMNYEEAEIKSLNGRKTEISIAGAKAVIRVITKEDLKIAERKNPAGKPFVTQEALFELVKVEADEVFNNKQDASIRFPLYQAIEKIQNQKVATLKKL